MPNVVWVPCKITVALATVPLAKFLYNICMTIFKFMHTQLQSLLVHVCTICHSYHGHTCMVCNMHVSETAAREWRSMCLDSCVCMWLYAVLCMLKGSLVAMGTMGRLQPRPPAGCTLAWSKCMAVFLTAILVDIDIIHIHWTDWDKPIGNRIISFLNTNQLYVI